MFKKKKRNINELNFCQKPKIQILENFFSNYFPIMGIFLKNSAQSVFDL